MLPPGLVLTAPHEAWSPISGLSRHVAVVILALVCVGYNDIKDLIFFFVLNFSLGRVYHIYQPISTFPTIYHHYPGNH